MEREYEVDATKDSKQKRSRLFPEPVAARLTPKRRAFILLVLGMCALAAVTAFRLQDYYQLTRSRRAVTRADFAFRATEALRGALLDAETGQRGYLVTGLPKYLVPYDLAVARMPEILSNFRANLEPYTKERPHVRRVEELVSDKLRELSGVLMVFREQGPAAAFEVVRGGKGQVMMDQLRSESDNMLERVFATAARHTSEIETRSRLGVLVTLIGTAVAFFVLLSGTLQLNEAFSRDAERLSQIARSEEEFRLLANRLQSVREEERASLAREIHDALGGALTGIKLDMSATISRLRLGEQDAAITRLQESSAAVDETIRSLRRIASELRPPLIDHLGLAAAAGAFAREFAQRLGVSLSVDIQAPDLLLPPDARIALFRIVQESFTNIARHANASAIALSLIHRDGEVTIEIKDDGQGFSTEGIESRRSFGLLGMRERARLLGASMSIDSAPGQGTTVRVCYPLPVASAGEVHG
jgi:signal transduction histidine kinase